MSSLETRFRSFVRTNGSRVGFTLFFTALSGLILLSLTLRFGWIDIVELGLQGGIDGISGALLPLRLLTYGLVGTMFLGSTLLVLSLVRVARERS